MKAYNTDFTEMRQYFDTLFVILFQFLKHFIFSPTLNAKNS